MTDQASCWRDFSILYFQCLLYSFHAF